MTIISLAAWRLLDPQTRTQAFSELVPCGPERCGDSGGDLPGSTGPQRAARPATRVSLSGGFAARAWSTASSPSGRLVAAPSTPVRPRSVASLPVDFIPTRTRRRFHTHPGPGEMCQPRPARGVTMRAPAPRFVAPSAMGATAIDGQTGPPLRLRTGARVRSVSTPMDTRAPGSADGPSRTA